jgi:hypothetical protein
LWVIGSEEAAASVCPQNRVYDSVHGSSRNTYFNIKTYTAFNVKVALEAYKEDKTVVELISVNKVTSGQYALGRAD